MAAMATTKDWNALSPADRAAQAGAMAAYGAMAEAADAEVGRLVAHLKATGDYENTVFVFLSDNGAEPTDPRLGLLGKLNAWVHYDLSAAQQGRRGSLTFLGPSWASAASSPLRGYKFSAAEGGLRVPLIVAWPGNPALTTGKIAARFTHVTDIAPTLLALANVAGTGAEYRGRAVEPMRGSSLLPVLTGATDSVHTDTNPIGYELSGNAALFRGDYKLVRNLPPVGDGSWLLYDILNDPGETRDLSRTMPERFRTMQADYTAFAARDQVLPMPAGYTAEAQIASNLFHKQALPKLLRIGAVVVLAIGLFIWRRRRKAARLNR